MLSFVFTDTEKREHRFDDPLTLNIRMDEDVPADDLYAVFPYRDVGELTRVAAYDGGTLAFVGVVDEQERILSEKGRFLRVSARSLAAHLLDNEAPPQTYSHPSASLIFERHIAPYGIVWDEDDATYFGEQVITKGTSQWAVLKNFCNACYSTAPRITADGRLRMKDSADPETVSFSDSGGGIAYSELYESKKRCEEISCVNIKVSDDEGYCRRIENADAAARGIVRERYLNAILAATPVTCADSIIANGEAASYSMTLKCGGRLTDCMGKRAIVQNRLFGERKDLYISGVSYRLDANGDSTTLRLKRRSNLCGYQDM